MSGVDVRARWEELRSKMYERCPADVRINFHQLVPGRSWILVGKGGRRGWMKFIGHRDTSSIWVSDNIDGASIALLRVYVLGVHTLPELAVQLKMLCDKSGQVHS
jgi:hypothetical protein